MTVTDVTTSAAAVTLGTVCAPLVTDPRDGTASVTGGAAAAAAGLLLEDGGSLLDESGGMILLEDGS